jgi:hypothetical protein
MEKVRTFLQKSNFSSFFGTIPHQQKIKLDWVRTFSASSVLLRLTLTQTGNPCLFFVHFVKIVREGGECWIDFWNISGITDRIE